MQDAKSVIVYGPQGCGKTRSAEALMKHFGVGRVMELDECKQGVKIPVTGVLVLTSMTREDMVKLGTIDQDARRVFSFEEATAMMKPTDTKQWADINVNDGDVQHELTNAGNLLTMFCHGASLKAGWWHDNNMDRDLVDLIKNPQSPIEARLAKALVAEKLCLTHGEVSEGMEGHRKGLMDDKITHRPMLEVELADAVIRIADLAGALDFDLGGAIAEKMAFNAVRPDHKKEAREAAGGKAY
jgi:NTP pyrophosphatase (non-canonical NTP hydrolase)